MKITIEVRVTEGYSYKALAERELEMESEPRILAAASVMATAQRMYDDVVAEATGILAAEQAKIEEAEQAAKAATAPATP